MTPIKDKTYAIACLGPYDYNRYAGLGIFTGDTVQDEEVYYGFKLPDQEEICFFCSAEILCEAA